MMYDMFVIIILSALGGINLHCAIEDYKSFLNWIAAIFCFAVAIFHAVMLVLK